jgi:hypothetical protein
VETGVALSLTGEGLALAAGEDEDPSCLEKSTTLPVGSRIVIPPPLLGGTANCGGAGLLLDWLA